MDEQPPMRSDGTLPPAGWYADPSGEYDFRYWGGRAWTDDATDRHPDAAADPWFPHLMRFLGVYILFNVTGIFVVGVLWLMFVLKRVGYRKRDLLLTSIPFYGIFLSVVAFWRYTARSVTWPPRFDRPSRPLGQPWLKALAIGGWLTALVGVGGLIAAVATYEDDTMTAAEWRADFVDYWVNEGGAEPAVASCAADEIAPGIPYESEEALTQRLRLAFADCQTRVGVSDVPPG